jgi:hypothetical protein
VSQVEDPILTLTRLLKRYLWIVKDDGSLASIHVSQEWYDRELFKNYDGQITVGLDRTEDNKLSFDGNLRRRLIFARINVWVVDKPEQGIIGRTMRDKIRADVNRVIREKRNHPNEVDYYFRGIGRSSGTHKAYHSASLTEPSPNDSGWTELTDIEYQKIWYSDNDRFNKSTSENGKYALMLFRFKIDADEDVLKKIVLRFEGYGTAPAGNGTTIKVWNHTASTWQNAVSGTGGNDEVLTITLSSNLPEYVDADGYVYLLAKTTNPSDGVTPAVLYCDYAEIAFTVNGIGYADIVSFRDVDDVQVKPFIWRTEFAVKSWLFENVLTT